jgi:hypothetical protein
MNKATATKTFNDLPQWAKGVIAVGVVIGGGYLLYKYVLKPKSGTEIGQSEVESEILTAQEVKKLSYPNSAYYSMADAIETAVNDIGTNEQLIYTCLRNILDNAIRYSEANYLIHLCTRQIS